MKKIFLILAVLLWSISSQANLVVLNNSCGTINFQVLLHTNSTWTSCASVITVSTFTLAPYTSITFANNSSLGYCCHPNDKTFIPGNTQYWDACTFTANDGNGNIYSGTMDQCGINGLYFFGGTYCISNVLYADIWISGSTTHFAFSAG